nr:aminotransferase class IV [Psychrobacter aquaticus]
MAVPTLLDNRGLAYGDGFFTTMGVVDGQILWLDYHHQRLISHAEALQLVLDSDALLTTLQIYAQQLQQGMLKLIVTRAKQEIRGYGYTPSRSGSACEIWLTSSVMTVATTKQLHLADGRSIPVQPTSAAICLSSQIACLPPSLAGLKSLNRLDTVLASGELQRIKADSLSSSSLQPKSLKHQLLESAKDLPIGEGLLRDMSGDWVEGTMSNVFYQLADVSALLCASEPPAVKPRNLFDDKKNHADYLINGQWYTPSMAQSGVAGVMRQVIIDALSSTAYPVVIRSLQDEDLPRLTQFFFCNALRGVMPMSSLTLLSSEVVGF